MDWQGLLASPWIGCKAGPFGFHLEPAAHTNTRIDERRSVSVTRQHNLSPNEGKTDFMQAKEGGGDDWQGWPASPWIGCKAGPVGFHLEPAAHTHSGIDGRRSVSITRQHNLPPNEGQMIQNASEITQVSKGATDLAIRSRFGPRFGPCGEGAASQSTSRNGRLKERGLN